MRRKGGCATCIVGQEGERIPVLAVECTRALGVGHTLGRVVECTQVQAVARTRVPGEGCTRALTGARILGPGEAYTAGLEVGSILDQEAASILDQVAGCTRALIQIHIWLSTHPGHCLQWSFGE